MNNNFIAQTSFKLMVTTIKCDAKLSSIQDLAHYISMDAVGLNNDSNFN